MVFSEAYTYPHIKASFGIMWCLLRSWNMTFLKFDFALNENSYLKSWGFIFIAVDLDFKMKKNLWHFLLFWYCFRFKFLARLYLLRFWFKKCLLISKISRIKLVIFLWKSSLKTDNWVYHIMIRKCWGCETFLWTRYDSWKRVGSYSSIMIAFYNDIT